MYNENNLHKLLRYERERLGITQGKLSELTGFNKRVISYYETNQRPVPLAYLIMLSSVAGLELKDLIGPDEKDPRLDDVINESKEILKSNLLTKQELDLIIKLRSLPKNIREAYYLMVLSNNCKRK